MNSIQIDWSLVKSSMADFSDIVFIPCGVVLASQEDGRGANARKRSTLNEENERPARRPFLGQGFDGQPIGAAVCINTKPELMEPSSTIKSFVQSPPPPPSKISTTAKDNRAGMKWSNLYDSNTNLINRKKQLVRVLGNPPPLLTCQP